MSVGFAAKAGLVALCVMCFLVGMACAYAFLRGDMPWLLTAGILLSYAVTAYASHRLTQGNKP